MIDTADLAILETYSDTMNPVERGLVEELRTLFDERESVASLEAKIEELEGELDNARAATENAEDQVRDLERQLARETDLVQSAEHARDCAERALAELKARVQAVLS